MNRATTISPGWAGGTVGGIGLGRYIVRTAGTSGGFTGGFGE